MDIRLKALKDVDSTVRNIVQDFKKYLSDKTIPLDERWGNFIRHSSYLGDSWDYPSYGPIELTSLYDPPERYKTYTYEGDIAYLEEVLLVDKNGEFMYTTSETCLRDLETIGLVYVKGMPQDEWNGKIRVFLDEQKETILEQGYVSYVFDW